MKKSPILLALLLCTAFMASAFADQPIYKWTDSNGTLHYSDKPPKEAASDLRTLDLPAFPAQDPAKLAEAQAAQVASTTALLKELQAEDALRQQETALAQQQAQLQSTIDAADDQNGELEPAPVDAIYVSSPYVPRVYRRNLYGAHARSPGAHVTRGQSVMRRPASGPVFRP